MDYNSLLSQVSDTLGAQITSTQVGALVPISEAKLNRILNCPEAEVTVAKTVANYGTLPADYWQMRDVWLSGTATVTLEPMTMDSARRIYGTSVGTPSAWAVTGTTLVLFPVPNGTDTYGINTRYQKTLPPLSTGATTNWLITSHPDIYYYAVLLQAEAYIVNDERLPIWKAALDEAVMELNNAPMRKMHPDRLILRGVAVSNAR